MSAVGQELLSTLDQRCTADIEEFAVDTAVLYGNLIKPAIEIVSFSAQVSAAALLSALLENAERKGSQAAAQIWADQGPRQLGIFLAYFLLSSKWLQVIPPLPSLFTLLRPYLAHFPPVFPRFLRVFTVSTRRFQRAPSRNPGPRNGGSRTKTRDLGPSFDIPGAVGRITCSSH